MDALEKLKPSRSVPTPEQSLVPLGSNMHLINGPVKGAEKWPLQWETLSKFFLLDQDSKLTDLSETEVMKESTRDGHLLGSRVLQSPQSPPSSPVNTRLQQLPAGHVLRHLQRFGQEKPQFPGRCVRVGTPRGTDTCQVWQALPLTEDVPAAPLAPACLAPLAGPAKQNDK